MSMSTGKSYVKQSTSRDADPSIPSPILVPATSQPLPILSHGSHSSTSFSSINQISPRNHSVSPRTGNFGSESTPVVLTNKGHDPATMRLSRSSSSSLLASTNSGNHVARKISNSSLHRTPFASVTASTNSSHSSRPPVVMSSNSTLSMMKKSHGTHNARVKSSSSIDGTLPPAQSMSFLSNRPMKALTASSVSSATSLLTSHHAGLSHRSTMLTSNKLSDLSAISAFRTNTSMLPMQSRSGASRHVQSQSGFTSAMSRDSVSFSHQAQAGLDRSGVSTHEEKQPQGNSTRDFACQTSFGSFNPKDYTVTHETADIPHSSEVQNIENEIGSLFDAIPDLSYLTEAKAKTVLERSAAPDADKMIHNSIYFEDFCMNVPEQWSNLPTLELCESSYFFHGIPRPSSPNQLIAASRPDRQVAPYPQKPLPFHHHHHQYIPSSHPVDTPSMPPQRHVQPPPGTPLSERSVSASSEDGASSVSSYSTLPSSISSPDSTKVANILHGKDKSAFFSIPINTIPFVKPAVNPYRRPMAL